MKLADAVAARTNPQIRRTLWRDSSLPRWIGVPVHGPEAKLARLRDERLEMVDDEPSAHLVSSLCKNGRHAPALDVDYPVSVARLSFGWTRLTLHASAPARYQLHGRPLERDAWTPIFDALATLGWTRPELCSTDAKDVTLILGVPVRVIDSSSVGCHHVYIDAEILWKQYADLLGLLYVAGVLGGHTYPWAIERGQTMLIKPGLSKAKLRQQLELFNDRAAE